MTGYTCPGCAGKAHGTMPATAVPEPSVAVRTASQIANEPWKPDGTGVKRDADPGGDRQATGSQIEAERADGDAGPALGWGRIGDAAIFTARALTVTGGLYAASIVAGALPTAGAVATAIAVRAFVTRRSGAGDTIAKDERKEWRSARTLSDLCALTERWLTGDLKTQPGYYGSVDVDEDDAPGMTEALVALNRTGFLTENSQAGFDGEGYDGAHWTQVAAIDGYAKPETVTRIERALEGTPYVVQAFERKRWGVSASIVPVTWHEGHAYTHFGGGCTATGVRDQFEGAGEVAVEDVVNALQVVIYDPEPGRNAIWDDLRALLPERGTQ